MKQWCALYVFLYSYGYDGIHNLVLQVECRHMTQYHYSDVIMSVMTSLTTCASIVYSTVCPGADQRKHQSPALLAFVRGIHR